MRKKFNFTMGADPEFNLIMQNRRIQASETLSHLLSKDPELKRDENGMGFEYLKYGNMGWDGANSTAEIRPSPGKSADELVENIEKILTKLCERTPIIDLTTLSYFASVGGHIHFSVPKEYASNRKMSLVHKKLASFYLPLLLAENKINLQLRLKSSYGHLTDWRQTQYGNISTADRNAGVEFNGYEFRTPSAEWLTTKKGALATLAYVGTVYNEIINNPSNIKKYSDLFIQTAKQAEALQMLALSDYKSLTKTIFQGVKTAIKTFEFYPTYKDEIEYILTPDKVLKDKAKVSYNIAQGWGINPTMKQPSKKDLVNKKKIAELATKTDLDLMQSLINVSYNDDTNVQLFIKALTERVAVFDWRLKNSYFLFGTRKGIDDFIVFDEESKVYAGQDMIKTTGDASSLRTLMDKMCNKRQSFSPIPSGRLHDIACDIDPSHKGMKYMIGIPYELRIKHDINPFINMIYDLENKKPESFKPTDLTSQVVNSLKNDTMNKYEEKGIFCQIMNRTSENSDIVFDTRTNDASAQRRIMDAINNLPRLETEENQDNITTTVSPDGQIIERITNLNGTVDVRVRQAPPIIRDDFCDGENDCDCELCESARTEDLDRCNCGDCDECCP